MQEVFEKIITKLGNRAEKSENDDSRMYKGERIAFGDAIEKSSNRQPQSTTTVGSRAESGCRRNITEC